MAEPKLPPPGALVCAIMGRCDAPWNDALELLGERWGEVVLVGPDYPFTFSTYYQEEMGDGLQKRLFLWEGLLPQEALKEAKLFSNDVEARLAGPGGCREVNIDPGLLTLHNLVLATAKGYAHRIYMGGGIYGELTLLYQDGGFKALPWTYPDYRSEEVMGFMGRARTWLRERLKAWGYL